MSIRRANDTGKADTGRVHHSSGRFIWRLSEPYRSAVAITLLILLISLLGWMEKVDNDNAVKKYCKDVHEKLYPDYNGSYQSQCKNGEPKQ